MKNETPEIVIIIFGGFHQSSDTPIAGGGLFHGSVRDSLFVFGNVYMMR